MSTRITVRLDEDLYARLLLFAQGRSHGQVPEVSTIVREALEQYLAPRARQTRVRPYNMESLMIPGQRGNEV